MHSGRPDAIRVAVVDGDAKWMDRLAKDLGETIGAKVLALQDPKDLEARINGHLPCHVLLIGRDVDPDLDWLNDLRARYDERQLPIIVLDGLDEEEDDDEYQAEATRAGANACFDRSIHGNDVRLLEKLVYSLAYE